MYCEGSTPTCTWTYRQKWIKIWRKVWSVPHRSDARLALSRYTPRASPAIAKRLSANSRLTTPSVSDWFSRKVSKIKKSHIEKWKNVKTNPSKWLKIIRRERERGGWGRGERERKGMLDRTDGSKQKRRRQRNFQNTGRVCRLDTVCWWSSWMTTKIGNEEKDVCQSKKQSILIRF